MCGIVGYAGIKPAQPILLNCLSKLEYRGYDSCGIALADTGGIPGNGNYIKVFKDAVRVNDLARSLPILTGTLGIGHTRWATHGSPCLINAHPHIDCTGKIAVVHNGVINNYQILRKQLIAEGHIFKSETDTEVISHLMEKYYHNDLEMALARAISDIEGSYALIAIAEGEPGLVFARKDSPLIIGIGDGEHYLASDVPAILDYTKRVIYLENGDSGLTSANSIRINHNGQKAVRPEQHIGWVAEQTLKGGYEHFMLKEIHEQPRIIRDTITECLSMPNLPLVFPNVNGNPKTLLLLACGTSYHSSLIGKYIFERLTDISMKVELASEYNYYQNLQFTPVAIGITQSGETADTLKAMQRLKANGSRVVAITNVQGSTASKISDYTIYTKAGPEISVAATKSFTAQLTALYWLSLVYSGAEIRILNDLMLEFRLLPDKVQQALALEEVVAFNSARLANYDYVIFIARGINYAIAMEGALKLKEVSYIRSEAYAAGEIKHGPFALLGNKTPVVAIVARDNSYDAMLTNIREIKSRGSPVLAIVEDGDDAVADLADNIITVPRISPFFSPFVNAVVIQLLAYYTAKERQCPIDFPRNLAKSVTVE